MIACENSGHSVLDDFAEVSKIVDAGVITNEEFAIFQNAGYMGLYGQYRIVTSPNARNIWKEKKSFERKGN
jgi:hypothetical protein